MNKRNKRRCRLCDEFFLPQEKNQWYCSICPSGKDYSNWSLNPKRRLTKLYQMAKNRAKTKNLSFDIDAAYLWNLWQENAGRCALTGQEFDLTNWGNKGQVNPRAPSLDRIIPNLGYTKGNVRLITYHMNVSLSEFGIEEFERLIVAYKEVN